MKEYLIKDLGKVITGNTPSKKIKEYYDNEDIAFIKPDGIKFNEITQVMKANEYISEKARNKARIVKKDSVLVTCIGNIGKVGIVEIDEIAFNQQINAVVTNDLVLPRYLAYNLIANQRRLDAIANAPVVPLINKTQFENFNIQVHQQPSEQKKIVAVLDNLSKLNESKKSQLEEYDQLIKSRFVEMFGDIDLNIKKETWIKLGNITEIVTGTTPSTHDESNWDGNYLWITPAELNDDSFYVYDTERRLTEKGLISKSLKLMPKDTVLLSTRAPIGKTAIVGNPMTCNQGFKNFICKDSLNPIYLFSLLKFNKEYLNSIGTGTTFKEISKTTVSNIEIPVPDIKMQNQFADFIKQVDKLKFIVQKSLDETQILFDSLMQKYFG
jgi:type I restriction enzyme S subunit